MTDSIDLDAYFRRIHYTGPREATLETLRAIHRRHVEAIAFENLDPLMRRGVRLDPASLQRKLVHGGRGGYCYEQNLLLSYVLRALGFQVTGLAARVMWNVPEDQILPRTHMLLAVDIGTDRYIADVGFGGLTLTEPLRLVTDIEQPTSHEPFRLREAGSEYVLEAYVREAWRPLYRFGLQEQLEADYEAVSWYLNNHPASRFLNNLIAARVTAEGRFALLNDQFTIHRLGRASERRNVRSGAELLGILRGPFELRLEPSSELEELLESVVAQRPDPPPFAILGIDHVVLRTRDVERMRRFYCDVLGCRIEKIQASIGLVQLRAGHSLIDLVDVAGPLGGTGTPTGTEARNVDHVCLRIEPFDPRTLEARLRAHGIVPGALASRYGAEGEGLSLYLTDPDGNGVELKGPASR